MKPVLLFANDLDTLLPNYRVAKSLKIPLIYDSHELFCEVPELMNNPKKKKIWEDLEKSIVPKLKYCITVNQSIAEIFENKYGVKFNVIRNIPDVVRNFKPMNREDLRLPLDKKIILLQGAGINIDRGAEELVLAMKEVEGAILYIVGGGDVWGKLEELVKKNNLQAKVQLVKKLPKQDLMNYTYNSDLGISIDKNTNPNYYNSLPNKLFDYLQASVPVLASKLPEIERILKQYNAGWFINSHEPSHIAETINRIINSRELTEFRQNALKASEENNWAKEKEKYLDIIEAIQKEVKSLRNGIN